MGLYQPDTIATYEHRGRVYLVMVNEGDARDNGSGDSEDDRRGSAGSAAVKYVPDGMVFDSGSRLDRAAIRLGIYDDGRSDNKGVEPEGLALLRVKGRTLAFIGLERTLKSAFAVYDITDPKKVRFLDTIVSEGDVSPEGLKAFRADRGYYLAVANEVSDTTSLFRLKLADKDGNDEDDEDDEDEEHEHDHRDESRLP